MKSKNYLSLMLSLMLIFGLVNTAYSTDHTNSIGMTFKNIPAGNFDMGDHAKHKVRISNDFQMGVFEVTVGQFRAFVADSGYVADGGCWTYGGGGTPRSGRSWRSPGFTQSNRHPVVCVSHNDADRFISWLNKKEGGNTYRLPTEAEWEYAARAGTTTDYSWGDSENQADDYAWYGDNSSGRTHAVGGKKPNPWGLYDMHGNVWEWVGDWYDSDYYANSPATNPQGPSLGRFRVARGGGWHYVVRVLRSANRNYGSPSVRNSDLGFRLVRQP